MFINKINQSKFTNTSIYSSSGQSKRADGRAESSRSAQGEGESVIKRHVKKREKKKKKVSVKMLSRSNEIKNSTNTVGPYEGSKPTVSALTRCVDPGREIQSCNPD